MIGKPVLYQHYDAFLLTKWQIYNFFNIFVINDYRFVE